ncbi:hypothetical protein SAMN05216227_1001136 [Pseudorhodobacter antarcticus]|jgi:hypothetical protein|uniref:Porin n=1 Tax=Pseudorhodobacter antarcticus TaxID=1077947 RepID=A0A1H8AJD2_9RHOB|nr:hypothetical protein [Pseudorhodobacter antarcticus]SEM70074.1 hypothetical protein SAMN05216227_1001136 [Pseudorhodobacter antarcticus]
MKFNLILPLGVAALLPCALFAQTFDGSVTVGYGLSDISGLGTLHTPSIDGRFGYDLGNGLKFGADISGVRGSKNGLTGNVSALSAGVFAAYGFGNGVSLGAYGETASVDATGLTSDVSVHSYGLLGGYDVDQVKVTGFLGKSNTSPNLAAGTDITDLGIAGRFQVSDQVTLGGSFARSTVSNGGASLGLNALGLAGSFRANESWTVFGGLTDASISNVAGITTFGLGASYDMSGSLRQGSAVSLEFARSNVGGVGNINTLRIGLSVPLGATSNAVPLNSVAETAMNPRRNTVATGVLSTF